MTKSTYLGKCMYCGQQAMLEINDDIADSFEDKPDDWDTYISEEVTKICKCEGARAWALDTMKPSSDDIKEGSVVSAESRCLYKNKR